MHKISLVLAIFLFIVGFQTVLAQKAIDGSNKIPQICDGGLVNSVAVDFPPPEYPQQAKDKNIAGIVNVQISVDEQGNVTFARACSGNSLLRPEAEKAAMKAKFKPTKLSGQPVKVSGILVYKFPSNEEEIPVGIVNGKAKYLPKPRYPQEAKDFCADGKVKVEVFIGEDGRVISAKAISGDELLWDSAVKAAQKATFDQTLDVQSIKIKGLVVYNFVSERKCIEAGIVNDKAVYLSEPVFPKGCRCNGNVLVQIIVDESGNVVRARGISGNPLLQISSVAAALKTKFKPTFVDGGNRVFIKATLAYKF